MSKRVRLPDPAGMLSQTAARLTRQARSEMDLREQAPRPGHLTLGEWSWLPRMIDKARAKYTGNIGNYAHPCGRDRLLLDELGLSPDEFKEIILATSTDDEVLREIESIRSRKGEA